ncbi:MAG: helix-turn-helix domain-containing protein [Pseudomonadota bacterium]|nr:helix-turn-helix domain-containing protein [Pseudomonadota bacterium]MDP1903958.1 helix-turn-helix domain-containing protein [Pseudomonadota bacterium]MDP2351598.1 helix-turn-helix domain-containing protein [Pseudomonadota bacterium]
MKAPHVTGQCAEVLTLIRQHQPLLSFVLTADHAIPEAAARVHDLRAMGFYSLGSPKWPYPGFLTGTEGRGA